nr:MFS transporter [Pelagibacteraceae bacterium]
MHAKCIHFFFTLGIYFVYIPWNLNRLELVETDLGLWLFIFGIINLITNQFTGRIIIPKVGTKNIVIIGTILVAFCPYLLVTVNSYSSFMLVAIPFGTAIGFILPSNQTQISNIESKTKKIYTPMYQAFFSAGSLSGALMAAYVIRNDIDPQITFGVMAVLILLSVVFIYFFMQYVDKFCRDKRIMLKLLIQKTDKVISIILNYQNC